MGIDRFRRLTVEVSGCREDQTLMAVSSFGANVLATDVWYDVGVCISQCSSLVVFISECHSMSLSRVSSKESMHSKSSFHSKSSVHSKSSLHSKSSCSSTPLRRQTSSTKLHHAHEDDEEEDLLSVISERPPEEGFFGMELFNKRVLEYRGREGGWCQPGTT